MDNTHKHNNIYHDINNKTNWDTCLNFIAMTINAFMINHEEQKKYLISYKTVIKSLILQNKKTSTKRLFKNLFYVFFKQRHMIIYLFINLF